MWKKKEEDNAQKEKNSEKNGEKKEKWRGSVKRKAKLDKEKEMGKIDWVRAGKRIAAWLWSSLARMSLELECWEREIRWKEGEEEEERKMGNDEKVMRWNGTMVNENTKSKKHTERLQWLKSLKNLRSSTPKAQLKLVRNYQHIGPTALKMNKWLPGIMYHKRVVLGIRPLHGFKQNKNRKRRLLIRMTATPPKFVGNLEGQFFGKRTHPNTFLGKRRVELWRTE